jgi:H+/gluconate symporter-like permease
MLYLAIMYTVTSRICLVMLMQREQSKKKKKEEEEEEKKKKKKSGVSAARLCPLWVSMVLICYRLGN